MRKYCLDLRIRSIQHVHERYALVRLTNDNAPLPPMLPGQFMEVKVEHSPSTFLRRPISINFFDPANNELWLLVAAVGEGTRHLVAMREGETLNCLLPLGKGFTLPSSPRERILLVGGGVGVAPLLFLGSEIQKKGGKPTILLGARTGRDLLEADMFKKVGNVFFTTEDGGEGQKGFVTNHTILNTERFDRICTCGPQPMMKAVARYAAQADIDCEVSLENMMACGLGACLCCVEKTTDGNLCVCKDGPVFNTKKLLWQN